MASKKYYDMKPRTRYAKFDITVDPKWEYKPYDTTSFTVSGKSISDALLEQRIKQFTKTISYLFDCAVTVTNIEQKPYEQFIVEVSPRYTIIINKYSMLDYADEDFMNEFIWHYIREIENYYASKKSRR